MTSTSLRCSLLLFLLFANLAVNGLPNVKQVPAVVAAPEPPVESAEVKDAKNVGAEIGKSKESAESPRKSEASVSAELKKPDNPVKNDNATKTSPPPKQEVEENSDESTKPSAVTPTAIAPKVKVAVNESNVKNTIDNDNTDNQNSTQVSVTIEPAPSTEDVSSNSTTTEIPESNSSSQAATEAKTPVTPATSKKPDNEVAQPDAAQPLAATQPKDVSSGVVALVMAIAFAVVAVFFYVGLLAWRRYLEYRYGNRELLVNDLEFDTNDLRHFEL